MTTVNQKDNILEYELELDSCIIINDGQKSIYIASKIDKWLWPNKIYTIPTGIKIGLPYNSMVLLTGCKWLDEKIQVIPQIIIDDGLIYIQILNRGFLPRKILKEEFLANLTIIPRMECHIVNIKE